MSDDTPIDVDARATLDGLLDVGLARPLPDPDPTGALTEQGADAGEGEDPTGDDAGDDATGHVVADDDPDDDGDVTGRLIRPYAMTGGRTTAEGVEIPLEAQVLASSQGAARRGSYRWEAARLIELVETPLALVEIAARLEVPVGVARVLVADLVADGSLIVHLPPPTSSFTSLLEQVLDGVRDL